MSMPPFTFRPLVSGLAGPVREAQATRFRSLTGERHKRSARGSLDDFRPLGAEIDLDDEAHDDGYLAETADVNDLMTTDDFDPLPDEALDIATPGAVDAYGAGDMVAPLSDDEDVPITSAQIPIEEPAPDHLTLAPEVPEEIAAAPEVEPPSPAADMVSLADENPAAHPPEVMLQELKPAVTDDALIATLARIEQELVTRTSGEICAAIADALRDLVAQKYLDHALETFASEVREMLDPQLGGAVVVRGPRHLIDHLKSNLADDFGKRVQLIISEDATELSASYDNQSIATRSQEILDAFERAFAG